jgi:hypothetical protein
VIGVGPFHLPVEVLSVEPWVAWPEIAGSFLFVGALGAALATGAVALDATVFEPTLFDPWTRRRIRLATSPVWRTYVELVAPEMNAQLLPSGAPPLLGHATHWSVNEIGAVPVHVPLVPVSVCPTTSEPEMTGSIVFFGWLADATVEVDEESALAWPTAFVAVTRARKREPTSLLGTVYVELVAPPIDAQFAPWESQRRHWYEKVIGVSPAHEPDVAESVFPVAAVPETVGSAVF